MSGPSFDFYSDRWFGGTAVMSLAAKGIYIDLLAWQWVANKPIPLDESHRARIARCTVDELHAHWPELDAKFTKTSAGYVNVVLERQRSNRKDYRESASEKGRKGAAVRWGKDSPAIASANSPANSPRMAFGSRSSDLDLRSSDLDPRRADQAENVGRDVVSSDTQTHALARASNGYVGNPHHNPTNLINGADLRRHGQHGICYHDRGLCMPRALFDELMGRIGGETNTRRPRLKAWADGRVARLGDSVVGEDVFDFWRNAFAEDFAPATAKPSGAMSKGQRQTIETRKALARARAQRATP